MQQDFAETLTRLARDQMVRIRKPRGRCVVVFHGMAWVTQEGDPRDRLLVSGESFTFDRAGVALIHALEPTALVVLERDVAEAMAPVALEDTPLEMAATPLQVTRQLSLEHVYRRARRLRAVARGRLWRNLLAYLTGGWNRLRGEVNAMSANSAISARSHRLQRQVRQQVQRPARLQPAR